MAVYAVCEICGTRRDATKPGGAECVDKLAHKRRVGWVANWMPSRKEGRLQKTFGSTLEHPKDLADTQLRSWKTDRERGNLKLKSRQLLVNGFESVADEWWTKIVIGQNRIKDPHVSERTRLNMWKEFFGNQPIQGIIVDDVEEWLAERRESGIAINTINRDLKPLRWILSYAVTKGYIEKNPIENMESIKGGNIHDRWMTEEEVGNLLQTAIDLNDPDLADLIAVGVNTGFRLGNLERLTARDIDGGLIMARQTKSGVPYSVPIAPAIEPVLRRLIHRNPTGPLLLQRTQRLGVRFREVARVAGLYSDRKDNDRVTIHTLRHTFAVLYLKRKDPVTGETGDIYKLSKLLGHASVAITDKIYARFCPKEKLAQASLISTPIPQIVPALKVI